MLGFMHSRASSRKQRLFACSCVRRVWSQLLDERSQRAVEVAERHADGDATDAELQAAHAAAASLTRVGWVAAANEAAAASARDVASPLDPTSRFSPLSWITGTVVEAARYQAIRVTVARGGRQLPRGLKESELRVHAALAGCIFGNPFRPFITNPAWIPRNDGGLVKLATIIYDGRRWEELPLFADALEECGCTDQAVLDHLRGPGPHARGCHVLDALLGRN
jgi:hypothetical protein